MNLEEYKLAVPARLLQELDDYAARRVPPSHFLRAVLANNLYNAVIHADPGSLKCLRDIVSCVVNELPYQSCGSYEAVNKWLSAVPVEGVK